MLVPTLSPVGLPEGPSAVLDVTATFAPLFFGLALQFTGNYRLAILSLIVFFAAGLLVLLRVDVARASAEAQAK